MKKDYKHEYCGQITFNLGSGRAIENWRQKNWRLCWNRKVDDVLDVEGMFFHCD